MLGCICVYARMCTCATCACTRAACTCTLAFTCDSTVGIQLQPLAYVLLRPCCPGSHLGLGWLAAQGACACHSCCRSSRGRHCAAYRSWRALSSSPFGPCCARKQAAASEGEGGRQGRLEGGGGTCTGTHARLETSARAHTHTHTHTPANKCAHACTHTHTHTRTGACMSSRKTLHDHQKRACTHARMHLSSREPVCAMYACPTQPAPVQTDAHRLRMQTWVHTRTSAHVHSHAHTHSVTHAPA